MSGGKLYNPIPLIQSATNYIISIGKCYRSCCTSYMKDFDTQHTAIWMQYGKNV